MSKKSHLFLQLARPYVRRKLAKNFSDVRMNGLEALKSQVKKGPLILACNHVAWWDALLLVQLQTALECDGYCLMDAKNLRQLPFFRWVGALAIDRSSRRLAYRDLRRAELVLNEPGKVLAIFPHGAQRPAHLPLEFKSGVVSLAHRSRVPVVPVAIRYDYLESPRPVVHISAGDALAHGSGGDGRRGFLGLLESEVKRQMHIIDQELNQNQSTFTSLLGRRKDITETDRIPPGSKVLNLLNPESN